jgi:capsular polysaccharide biosynthesis protein
MHLPLGGSFTDLGLEGFDPAQRSSLVSRLAWRLGRAPLRPALNVTQSWDHPIQDLSNVVAAQAERPEDPGHALNSADCHAHRFIVARGRDIGMLRLSAGVFAPELGLIDQFNVGGAANAPASQLIADIGEDRTLAASAIERVPGLSIPFCHYGYQAFGHFILDGLLQVYLFRDVLASGEAKLAYWPLAQAWMEPLLERCGVPAGSRRVLRKPAAVFEQAGLSSALAGQGVYYPGAFSAPFFAWLREALVGPRIENPSEWAKVYIRRNGGSGARAVRNQDALEAMLVERGFTIVDPTGMDIASQAQAIAKAEVLVSAWGSGQTLAPLLGGARRVIELTPDNVTDPWFLRQAAVHGLDYWPVLHEASAAGEIEADLPAIVRALEA